MATPDGSDLRERPAGELLKELSQQTGTLVRQEVDLAKAELAQKGKELGAGAGLLIGGAVVALLAAGALTACVIAVLDTAMPTWLAALIVALVYAALAAALAIAGRGRIRQAAPATPEQTIETVKEDVQWAKTRARSGRT
jgi:hypothetical protein